MYGWWYSCEMDSPFQGRMKNLWWHIFVRRGYGV